MKEQLVEAIGNVSEEPALRLAQEMLDAGGDPRDVLDACRAGMAVVGQRYEAKEYFLPHLILAQDLLKQISDMVRPRLKADAGGGPPRGKVVIGTVEGDIHDIGKDIVAFMLEVNDFEVYDLGVDVPAKAFVEKIAEVNPEVVGMSGFLTLAFDRMKGTVEAIQAAGLRDRVKIMIGGAPMDDSVAQYVGADAYGEDAWAAVQLAKSWTGGE
ncbi:MAG: cobalamin B12-binding domain-containing protein [Anaerolineae bacterium]|jgi:methanogenic corrinoid protein MtbC1